MLATLLSATLIGLDGRVIQVEVDVAGGLPGFTIVGLADTALQEARERVRGAIRNAGFSFPPRRITVNLAPAEERKSGASLDLAIALDRHEAPVDDDPSDRAVGTADAQAPHRQAAVGTAGLRCHADRHELVGRFEDPD